MTFFHGLGMFIFSMFCLLIGCIIAYIIIDKIVLKPKKEVRLDDLE